MKKEENVVRIREKRIYIGRSEQFFGWECSPGVGSSAGIGGKKIGAVVRDIESGKRA